MNSRIGLFRGLTSPLSLAIFSFSLAVHAPPAWAARRIRIGTVTDGPRSGAGLEETYSRAILDLTSGDPGLEVALPKEKQRTADWTAAGVKAEIDRLLADPDVDVVLALGTIASNDAGHRPASAKTLLAPYVIDPAIQQIPFKNGTSGQKNLSYVFEPDAIAGDLKSFGQLANTDKIVVLAAKNVLDAIPNLGEWLMSRGKNGGPAITVVPVKSAGIEIEAALLALPKDAKAAYLVFLDEIQDAGLRRIAQGLTERKILSFSGQGRADVERGVMATMTQRDDDAARARRIALDVLSLGGGEDPASFPVGIARGEGLVINLATAHAMSFYPSWDALTEAEVLNATGTVATRNVTLKSAAEEAMRTNLDLKANDSKVLAGKEEIARARSLLLPALDVSATGAIIDSDRATASFGTAAERAIAIGATLKQPIFAEKAWANYSIQDHLQALREAEREVLGLDITLEAAQAYINILRAKTLEQIRVENLKKTRSNLELARVRSSIGSGGPSEVLRWESQLANDRRAVISASALRNAAEIALNRLLHRPLEEAFSTETTLQENELVVMQKKLSSHLDNPRAFAVFREFMVKEGLAQSPELRALDRAIDAQARALLSARASLFIPTVGLEATVRQVVAEGGEGKEAPMFPPPLPPMLFPPADDRTRSVGVGVSFPLFAGLGDFANAQKANAELTQRKVERQSAQEKIEQRVRSALHLAGGSFPGISLSLDAADAARKALEIVTNAYAQGAVGVIDLLDAQNAALVTQQLAVSASHDYLLDQLNVQRSVSWYSFLQNPKDVDAWFARFLTFYEAHKGDANP